MGDASLSLKWYVEELQHKYESKVEQRCGCHVKVLATMREDNVGSTLIPKEELREEMKALKATADGNCLFNSASISISIFHFHFISLKKRKYNDNPAQPADSKANRGGLHF